MKNSRLNRFLYIIKYMFFDIIMISLTYLIAIFMFMVLEIPVDSSQIWFALPAILAFKLFVFYVAGLYRMLENHIGFEDVIKITLVTMATNIAIVIFIALTNTQFMYKSAYFFLTIAEVGLVTFPRIINRIIQYLKTNIEWKQALGKRTLIVGAGSAGEIVVKEIIRNKDLNNIPVAFLDDDVDKIGKRLMGIKIVGPISAIRYYIDSFKAEEVIIAINNYPKEQLSELINLVTEKNCRMKRLLSMSDVDNSKPTLIDVKIEDLLNRDEIKLDNTGINEFIKDHVVLVTGGGGSIGSELCRQIAEFEPKHLVIFDIYENNAYDIQQELLRKFHKENRKLNLSVYIGSVYNRERLKSIFELVKPEIVFHAAAYKHVPLMEDSAVEAVRTNVIGTYNTASLSNEFNVKKFVLVSSDKAVRSTNVMGATKRYAELIIQEQQSHSKVTKFSAVRFGNVLGSNGSVIPLFKKQIADGGPVTVTHPDITRYFMTIPEAVGLILQCGVYANGGEVFILDMGAPVKIKDLAEKMISLAGFKPYKDIDIEFTGLRPGEKLFEELLVDHNHEDHCKTDNKKIFIEKQREVLEKELELEKISSTLELLKNDEVKHFVASIITTYKRNGEIK
ncbi:MAG TPA: nucleoside-diphosphate sugar epimerase/dehydratase [Acholeplasmataceae bacterium]|nr:nucleoside-diphosphate sugar epimerase/dehydratase [Acholeplasmataceae bacterium]